MMVGLGVGLAVGAGYRPTPAAAQPGAAAVAATARVLPAIGVLPSEVRVSRPAGWTSRPPWERDGAAGPGLPSFPATTVTREVLGNHRIIELAATGV